METFTPDMWFVRLLFGVFVAGVIVYLFKVRRGKQINIRRLAGLDKIDEAIGRAVEMGRPVWFVPGIGALSDPGTLTAFGLLERTAALCARYNVRLLVAAEKPEFIPVLTNIVREAYRSENKRDLFNEDDIRFLPGGQFYFVIAAMGWMRRERVAASLLFGAFWAEALMLSETGQQIGAVQIAGTQNVMQIPFFVTTCDYVLIGEEFLAAHAYIVREPVHLASTRTQDLLKGLMMGIMVLGVVGATLVAAGVLDVNFIAEALEKFSAPLRKLFGGS